MVHDRKPIHVWLDHLAAAAGASGRLRSNARARYSHSASFEFVIASTDGIHPLQGMGPSGGVRQSAGKAATSRPSRRASRSARGMWYADVTRATGLLPTISRTKPMFSGVFLDLP